MARKEPMLETASKRCLYKEREPHCYLEEKQLRQREQLVQCSKGGISFRVLTAGRTARKLYAKNRELGRMVRSEFREVARIRTIVCEPA